MKKQIAFATLAAASIIGIVSLMTHPAQSQQRPTPTTPAPVAPPPGSIAPANKMTAPQINAAPAQREKMSKNPNSATSLDVGKNEKQKAEKKKNDDAALERRQLEKKVAEDKKKEKQKMYAVGVCKKKCTSDPCGCAKFGDTVLASGTTQGGVVPGSAPGTFKKQGGVSFNITMQQACKKECSTTVSACQASC